MAHFFESSNETIIQKNQRKKKVEKKDTFSEAIDHFKEELESIKSAQHKKFNKKFEQFLKIFKSMKNLTEEQVDYFHDFLQNINIEILNKSNEKKVKSIIATEEEENVHTDEVQYEENDKQVCEENITTEVNFNVELVRAMKISTVDLRTSTIENILHTVIRRDQVSENIINKLPFKISHFDFLIAFAEKFNFEQALLDCHYMTGNYIHTENREYRLYYNIYREDYELAKKYYLEHMNISDFEKLADYKYKFIYDLALSAAKNKDYAFALDLILLVKKFYFDCIEKPTAVNEAYKNIFYAIDLLLILNSENILHKKEFTEFFDRFLIFNENQLNVNTGNLQMEIYRAFYEKEMGREEYVYEIISKII